MSLAAEEVLVATLEVHGASLYYEVHGSGPALIFAHGLGGNHLSWWQQVPVFKDRYTCVVFAHRGFGLSKTASPEPQPGAFRDDLAALIDHLGFAEVRLVAQSMGGWTCLAYALAQPERVKALVMASTVGGFGHPAVAAMRAAAQAQAAERGLLGRGIHPAAGERMATEQPAMAYLYRSVSALNVDLATEKLRAELMARRDTPPETVAQLTTPTLCLVGAEDIVIPPDAVELLAKTLPNARFVKVPQAGHSVYWERPAEFNDHVARFFAEVGA